MSQSSVQVVTVWGPCHPGDNTSCITPSPRFSWLLSLRLGLQHSIPARSVPSLPNQVTWGRAKVGVSQIPDLEWKGHCSLAQKQSLNLDWCSPLSALCPGRAVASRPGIMAVLLTLFLGSQRKARLVFQEVSNALASRTTSVPPTWQTKYYRARWVDRNSINGYELYVVVRVNTRLCSRLRKSMLSCI